MADNKTSAEVMAWWQTVMHSWSFNPTKPLNYPLEIAPIALKTHYVRPAGQHDWINWRTVADQKLIDLNRIGGQTSDIRIWPHHFDAGVYYSIPAKLGKE